jgi:biotin carboxyl carrier protein
VGKIKQIEVTLNEQLLYVKAEELDNCIWFHLNGRIFVLDKQQPKLSSVDEKVENSNKNVILSPMPGQIIKVLVQSGSQVEENQTLLILSSMKMEYTIKSPFKAVIGLVKVKEGEQVVAHQELVLFNST